MAGNNMHNLTTLIKRLEAATSRLEDIAQSTLDSQNQIAPDSTTGVAVHDAASVPPSEAQAQKTVPKPVNPLPPTIGAFDSLINNEVKAFVSLSDDLGGLIAEQASKVLRAFAAERKFLVLTTRAKKPDIQSPAYLNTLQELHHVIEAVNEVKLANRGSDVFIHLSMVSEGVPMVGWVAIDVKPVDFVTEMHNSAQFYGDKVLKEYKGKDSRHVDWVRSFYGIHKALKTYVEEHYNKGVTWNKDGIDAPEAMRQLNSEESVSRSGSEEPLLMPSPPPPPPLPTLDAPPPPPPPPSGGATRSAQASDMGAVFNQISQGENVTKGLRKVDPSQMTHKNPSLRTTSAVPPTRSDSLKSDSSASIRGKSPTPAKKPQSLRTKKPPRKELDGRKWVLENFDNPEGMIEIEANLSQSILVTKCNKTAIRVIGKANAVRIDSSSAVSLVVDSLVSSVEVIKVPKFEMQVLGYLPTIILDQIDGAAIYLSRESLGTEVFTSKCTGVNINVPGAKEEDDYAECAVPEQLKTVVRNGKAVSEIVEHAG